MDHFQVQTIAETNKSVQPAIYSVHKSTQWQGSFELATRDVVGCRNAISSRVSKKYGLQEGRKGYQWIVHLNDLMSTSMLVGSRKKSKIEKYLSWILENKLSRPLRLFRWLVDPVRRISDLGVARFNVELEIRRPAMRLGTNQLAKPISSHKKYSHHSTSPTVILLYRYRRVCTATSEPVVSSTCLTKGYIVLLKRKKISELHLRCVYLQKQARTDKSPTLSKWMGDLYTGYLLLQNIEVLPHTHRQIIAIGCSVSKYYPGMYFIKPPAWISCMVNAQPY
jgi:hypothetical protein